MGRLIDKDKLIAEYDRVHQGPPGGARKLMEEAEDVPAIPLDWINRFLDWLEKVNNDMSLRDAKGIRVMLAQWRTGRSKFDAPEGCGSDSCNILK